MYERNGYIIQNKFKEYLIPTVLTSMAVSMASVVDGIIVGSLLGDVALAAIGLASPVIFCINLIYMLFAIGGITCASIAQGKRDFHQSNISFTLSIGGGLIVMSIFLAGMQTVLQPLSVSLAGGDMQLALLTEQYLRPLLFTGPALMFSSGMAMFIRTDGKPKASAVIVMIANGVNLVFDYVLIRFLDAGIWGAGFSTTLGYVAGSVIVIPYLFNKKRSFQFVLPGKNDMKNLGVILKTGLPKAAFQVCNLLRSLVINSIIVASLGSIGMSIMTVCTNVLMISNIFVGGISDTLLPIVGTLYGERDYFGMRHAMKTASRVLAICTLGLVIFFVAAPQLMGIAFGIRTAEAMELLKPALRMFAFYLPFYSFTMLYQNFYNTTGRRNLATVLVILDGILFVVPFALLLSSVQANLLWLCYAASGACTLIVLQILAHYIRKKEQVEGMMLIRVQNDYIHRFDLTIDATKENAVILSQKVLEWKGRKATNEKLLNRIASALEEMVIVSVHYAHSDEKGIMDILIHVTDKEVLIQMRDNGKMFNPMEYIPEENDGCITDGIQLAKKMAARMEYSRQLGFNNCVMSFENRRET